MRNGAIQTKIELWGRMRKWDTEMHGTTFSDEAKWTSTNCSGVQNKLGTVKPHVALTRMKDHFSHSIKVEAWEYLVFLSWDKSQTTECLEYNHKEITFTGTSTSLNDRTPSYQASGLLLVVRFQVVASPCTAQLPSCKSRLRAGSRPCRQHNASVDVILRPSFCSMRSRKKRVCTVP